MIPERHQLAASLDDAITTLQVIASPQLGGAEIACERISGALSRAGQAATCVLRRGARLLDTLAPEVARYELPMRSYWDLGTVLQIRRLLKSGRWPIVQSWATRATWLTRAPRDVVHLARIGGYYNLRRFRHADGWIVNTGALADWLVREGFPRERVSCIDNFVPELPSGLAPPLTRSQFGIPDDALLIASIGRLVKSKGVQDLIAAVSQLPRALGARPLHLLLIGDGVYRAELGQLAETLGVQDRVHFAGWIGAAVAAMPVADAIVLPSHKEALGNVILEAWSQRLPVLSTCTDGGKGLIQDGINGLLTPIADSAALAAALQRLLIDEGLRSAVADAGHATFESRYSEQATVAAYLAFYRHMLKLGPRKA